MSKTALKPGVEVYTINGNGVIVRHDGVGWYKIKHDDGKVRTTYRSDIFIGKWTQKKLKAED